MKLYTPLINKALNTAYTAHHGQLDEYGVPYIYHPAFVAAQMDAEDEIAAALLHDVVEKTRTTFEDLEREGFPQTVTDALHLLTRKGKSSIANEFHLIDISHSPLAVKVKLADMRHNGEPSRLASLPPEDAEKLWKRYEFDIRILSEFAAKWTKMISEAENGVPQSMLRLGIRYYRGEDYVFPIDRRKAFDLISRAIERGLPREQSDKDYPPYEYGELKAARFAIAMLLRDDDGIVSSGTEPFFFEKPWDRATDIEQIFMLATGRGGVKRDLKKAADMAWSIFSRLSFSHDTNDNAEDIAKIIECARKKDPDLSDW